MIVLDTSRMRPLDVERSKLPLVMGILLALIMVPLGLVLVVSSFRGSGLFSLVLGAGLLALLGLVLFLMLNARKRAVKTFSSSGILLADRTEVPWNNLLRVVDKIALNDHDQPIIWRTELEFTGGRTAWLIPNRISNFDEVYALVKSLDCPQEEKPSKGFFG